MHAYMAYFFFSRDRKRSLIHSLTWLVSLLVGWLVDWLDWFALSLAYIHLPCIRSLHLIRTRVSETCSVNPFALGFFFCQLQSIYAFLWLQAVGNFLFWLCATFDIFDAANVEKISELLHSNCGYTHPTRKKKPAHTHIDGNVHSYQYKI